jgi:hypothetical protein
MRIERCGPTSKLSTTRCSTTHLLKLRPELVKRVTVRSVGYSDVVDVLEASDVELN